MYCCIHGGVKIYYYLTCAFGYCSTILSFLSPSRCSPHDMNSDLPSILLHLALSAGHTNPSELRAQTIDLVVRDSAV